MKRQGCVMCIAFLLTFSLEMNAQLVGDTARLSESIWSMKKKKLVLEYLDLTEAQKASFWPLYESYSQSIRFIEMETLQILNLYEQSGHSLDPAEIEKYTKQVLLNDLLLAKVRRQYYRKFSKALSPRLATRFMQFDKTIRTMIQHDLQPEDPANLAEASL